ncbi:hypothetical protein Bbelb_283790 [Branchiostoma belcheri]|nr:hypothetical protein Bbelb_283790 [Branchiostoma belcheri]
MSSQWLERDSSWVVDSSGVWVDDKGRAYDAAKALDGEKGTYWNAQAKGQGQYNYNNWYFVLDLITSHTLTRIAVKNYGDTTHDIAAFTLQKSQAGSPYSWVDVVSVDNVTGGTRQRQEFGGFQGTARYWRFVVTRTHSGWQPWLPELNFYGILRDATVGRWLETATASQVQEVVFKYVRSYKSWLSLLYFYVQVQYLLTMCFLMSVPSLAVVGPDFKAASCSEMKSSFPASKDGEYTLHPFSTCEDVSLRVYCHNMASEQPEEFLTLPSGPENNFANIFADRLYNGGQCDGQLQGPYARRAGTTKFSKIRIKFENSKVKVIRDDYTFASTVGYNNVSYGEAGDCYSSMQGCAKGTFKLNLTGTDLSLASDVHWVMDERYPDYLRINDMFISEERTVASARCGGWCGHCWPVGKTLFLSHPQCDSSNKNRVIKGCPIAGYVGFDGICYKSFTEQKTRDEARQACAADGGILAMPKDSATNTFLANLAGVVWGRWFGLTDVNNDGQWVFEDGQNLTSSGYANWLPGEPRPDYGKGGCVGFWEDESFWDEKDCSKLRGFICQLQLQDYCIEESVDTEVGQVTFPRTDGGSFSYSAERCNSSEGNEKPLATRFCRIIPDSTAVWDQPVVLRCDTDLQNLSQVRVYTKLSQVRVYTKLPQVRVYTKLSQVRVNTKLSQVRVNTKLSQVRVYTKLSQVRVYTKLSQARVYTKLSQVRVYTKMSQVRVYTKLSKIVVNNETALSVATELQVITTQAETLSSGDVDTVITTLQKIVNASATEQSACLPEALAEWGRIGDSLLTTVDNLIKVNATVLQQSQEEMRGPTRAVQALETFADTVILTTDTYTAVRPRVALQAADISPEELDKGQVLKELDTEPTAAELEKAIDALTCGKAPGNDAIPPEVIKQGKPALLPHLQELLSLCWKEGSVPQDMRDAKIVTLFKNKGDRSVCDNYRGISLLNIVGKLFARVVLSRLQVIADRVYPETQCGFRAGRSTIDMVFSVRQLQEKCREQNQPLYLAFVDLTKAFDLVSRSGLFKLLERIGCPPKLLSIIKSFHDNMRSTVSFDGNMSEPFPILSGVKQGCVLAPTLFGIFFSLLLSYAFRSSNDGVYIHTRHDGKLFNLARLRAKTKTIRVLLRELLFADDAALASHSEQGLQRLPDCFSSACHEFSLTISIKKTVVMVQNAPCPPLITVNDSSLAVVDRFTYLGSTATHNLSLDIGINTRIGRAASVMSKLKHRVWENKNLSIQTKLRVYEACVLGTLLYGSETWSTYAVQEAKLNAFHMRCLRRILGITWMDRVTNSEVLRRSRSRTMYAILSERRLRWLGHVRRMDQGRIPKDLLYGQFERGTRKKGRSHLRYKDVCKRDLRAAHIDSESWENIALNRTLWKSTVKTGRLPLKDRSIQPQENLFKEARFAFFLSGNDSDSLTDGDVRSFTTEDGGDIQQTADISISLPPNISSMIQIKNLSDVRLSYTLYNSSSLFVQLSQGAVGPSQSATVRSQGAVGTRIIGGRIAGRRVKDLPEPVITTFVPLQESFVPEDMREVKCVFWDFDADAWSTEGCESRGENMGRYTCACNHLTNFAIIFDVSGESFGDHEKPLEVITIVGCVVSIVCLVLTLFSFIVTRRDKRRTRTGHAKNQRLVLINLCVALLATLVIFLAGINRTASPIGCKAVAALLHYFLLAALMWMAVEAVNLYRAVVQVFDHVSENFVIKAGAVAWAGLILLFNLLVFILVMYKLVLEEKKQKELRGADAIKVDRQWIILQIRRACSIMALFGLTWVFGFFVIDESRTVFAYLFCIFNTLQGLFIFIFHCVMREGMKEWRKKMTCWKKFIYIGKKKQGQYQVNGSKSFSSGSQAPQTILIGLSTLSLDTKPNPKSP